MCYHHFPSDWEIHLLHPARKFGSHSSSRAFRGLPGGMLLRIDASLAEIDTLIDTDNHEHSPPYKKRPHFRSPVFIKNIIKK
jgi:hypothetical protein